MSRNQTIGTVVARLIVFSGYQWYTAHQRQVELSEGLTDLVYSELRSIQSAIFDANWQVQQVREPAAPASAALLRQGAQDLIMARERLHVLSYPIFHPVVNTQQLGDLADRVHVIALKLQDAADQGDAGRAAGYSKALRELNEGLADRYFTIEQFSSELAQVLAPRWPNVNAIPDAPPGMQLIVGGSYAPVRRGGYCWGAPTATCVDAAGPAQLVAGMTAHVAPPGTNAELRFAWPPKTSSVKLFRIPGDGQQVPIELGADLTFTLPQEPGTYIYYAHAEWEQGSGTFAFALDVKN